MYKCLECGAVFEEPVEWVEDGMLSACPNCGGDYEEMVKCDLCDEYYLEDEMIGCVCKHCLEDDLTPEGAVTIGCHAEVETKLNGFLMSVFSDSEINSILAYEFYNLDKGLQKQYADEYFDDLGNDLGELYKEAVKGGEF